MPSNDRGDDPPQPPGTGGAAARKAVSMMKFGDHLCLPYDDADERRAILISYVRDGLRDDHKIIYLSDQDPPETILGWLQGDPEGKDFDLAGAMERDQFVVRTAEEAYMATGRFDPDEIIALFATEIDVALVQGYAGVRVTGEETFSLRGWPGTERFAEFERKIDEVFRTSEVSAMAICQYDRQWFDEPRLRKLESYHVGRVRVNDYFDDGNLRITPTYRPPGLALAGELDESTFPALVEALRSVQDRTGHICLDLSQLGFCDMGGLRALIGANHTSRGLERQVILREPPGYVGLMMRIAGWDSLPGVYVEEAVE